MAGLYVAKRMYDGRAIGIEDVEVFLLTEGVSVGGRTGPSVSQRDYRSTGSPRPLS